MRPVRPRPPRQNLHLCVMEIPGRRTLVTTGAGWRRTLATLWLHLTVVIARVSPWGDDAIGSHMLHVLLLLLLLLLLRGGGFCRLPRVNRRDVLMSCLRWPPTLVLRLNAFLTSRGHRGHELLPVWRWDRHQ